jgi:tetratricopeptide (TPR) repeat protein
MSGSGESGGQNPVEMERVGELESNWSEAQARAAEKPGRTLVRNVRPGIVAKWFRQAHRLHENGKFVEAERLYRQILAVDPRNADCLNLLGVIAYQHGQHKDAVELIGKALAVNRRAETYYSNLGNALHALGRFDEAAASFRQALVLKPDFAEAAYNLGNTLMSWGKLEEAAASYARTLSLQPNHAEAYCNLGNILQAYNRLDEAAEAYTRALALKPNLAAAEANLGLLRQTQGKLPEAEAAYQRALGLVPANANVCFSLGNVFQLQGKMAEATECYTRALALELDHAELHFNWASALQAMGKMDEAAAHYLRAIEMKPDYAGAYGNLGCVLFSQGKLEESEAHHKRALALNPALSGEHYNLANTLRELNRPDEAIAEFERALALEPDNATVLYNLGQTLYCKGERELATTYYHKALAVQPSLGQARLSLALEQLAQGDFANGWQSYESRWLTVDAKPKLRAYPQPFWKGESLNEGRLLIWREQGVGDEIMLAGLLPDVLGSGTRFIFECDPRLQPLFARSFPQVELIPGRVNDSEVAFAAHMPSGNLPGLYRTSAADFSRTVSPYLAADAEERKKLHEGYSDGRKVIGLAWYTKNPNMGRMRCIDPCMLAPLFARPDLRWVSLQYGNPDELEAQVAAVNAPILIDRSVDQLTAMDRFASQVAAMDLVITIDNSTAHLAGALGVPVWLLLPFSADWRWLLARSDSPWYPTMRIFRQSEAGDWPSVVSQLLAAL